MISMSFDNATDTVKTTAPAIIKVGAGVPLRLSFSEAPGVVTNMKLGIGSDATPPVLLAKAETWTQENETTWTATLDGTATDLVTYMAARATAALNAEFTATFGGVRRVSPNFAVTAQKNILPTS